MDLSKQASLNTIGSIALLFGQWLISVLLVRIDGFEAAGIFSLAMSISNVFSAISNYGIRTFQITDVSGRFSQKSYLTARVVTSLLAFLLCLAYRLVAGSYSALEYGAIVLYLLYSITNYISDVMLGTLQLQGKLQYNGYSNILRSVCCFAGFMGAFFASHNLLIALGVMVVGTVLVTAFYDYPRFRQYKAVGFTAETKIAKDVKLILQRCFPLMASLLLPLATTAWPRNVIQAKLGNEALGYFSSVFTPTVLLITLIPCIVLAVTPAIAKAWQEKNTGQFLKFNSICYGATFGLCALALLAAFFVGKPVMGLIFGEEILPYYNLLYWAILAMGASALSTCMNSVLAAMEKNTAVMVAAGMAFLTVMCLSGTFVSRWGLVGAAYGLLAAYLVQAGILGISIVLFYQKANHTKKGL